MLIIETGIESARKMFIKEFEDWQEILELNIDYDPDTLRFAVFVNNGEIINVIPIIESAKGKDYWILIPWKFNKRYVFAKHIKGIGRAAEFKVFGDKYMPTFRSDLVEESEMPLLYI